MHPSPGGRERKHGRSTSDLWRDLRAWGEPPALVADKIAKVRATARKHGRKLSFGIRLHVIVRETNDENYRVGGIPQIHLIDRQGRIRLIMVGYDDANEPKLAKFIAALLAEK